MLSNLMGKTMREQSMKSASRPGRDVSSRGVAGYSSMRQDADNRVKDFASPLQQEPDMKPVQLDGRTGRLTLEQYLGLGDGMSLKVAGRMLTLAADYVNDVVDLHEDALDPRLPGSALMRLARAATGAETQLARLLVLAAEHCRGPELSDVPLAIRSNMKTLSRCRSAICGLAMAAEEHGHSQQIAA